MAVLVRWAGVAAFCLVFGFIGSAGAVWLMADHLRGEPGPRGDRGSSGPARPAGPAGPASMNVTLSGMPLSEEDLSNLLSNVVRAQRELGDEIRQLQDASVTRDCFPTQVVTDVQESTFADIPLTVRKTMVCLPTP